MNHRSLQASIFNGKLFVKGFKQLTSSNKRFKATPCIPFGFQQLQKKNPWLLRVYTYIYIYNGKLPSYVVIFLPNHYKDPYFPPAQIGNEAKAHRFSFFPFSPSQELCCLQNGNCSQAGDCCCWFVFRCWSLFVVGWLFGCLVVWLFGWLVGWLVGCCTCCPSFLAILSGSRYFSRQKPKHFKKTSFSSARALP